MTVLTVDNQVISKEIVLNLLKIILAVEDLSEEEEVVSVAEEILEMIEETEEMIEETTTEETIEEMTEETLEIEEDLVQDPQEETLEIEDIEDPIAEVALFLTEEMKEEWIIEDTQEVETQAEIEMTEEDTLDPLCVLVPHQEVKDKKNKIRR